MILKRITYYVKSGDILDSYLMKYSDDTDVNPFITYSENEDWEKITSIPVDAVKLREDKKDDYSDIYYYTEDKIVLEADKHYCCKCKYYVSAFRFSGDLSLCTNKQNTGIDYVKNEILKAPCIKFNSNGQCRYFSLKRE